VAHLQNILGYFERIQASFGGIYGSFERIAKTHQIGLSVQCICPQKSPIINSSAAKCKAPSREYMALLRVYMALLREYMALLREYMALLVKYKATCKRALWFVAKLRSVGLFWEKHMALFVKYKAPFRDQQKQMRLAYLCSAFAHKRALQLRAQPRSVRLFWENVWLFWWNTTRISEKLFREQRKKIRLAYLCSASARKGALWLVAKVQNRNMRPFCKSICPFWWNIRLLWKTSENR